ncbi:hypothetical protein GCM10022280_02060 [Sphingomonas swuensis]|uniref:Prepilin type IV endopeptidase peptidase domain-containing protein n=1 Tax=Sphingomonas swuensis TaxID=977800 RepID=A0ABP7S9S7_9SPHN
MNLPLLAPQWAFWTLIVLLVLAALQDAAKLKISNYLVGAVLLLGILAAILAGPRLSLWENGLSFVIALTIGTFLFGRGMLGGGDVKLFAATILWFEFGGALRFLLMTAIAGGVLAVVLIFGRMLPWPDAIRSRVRALQPKAGIPYGIAIAAGAILTSSALATAAAFAPGQ